MKQLLFILSFFIAYNALYGQISNGSFENSSKPDLSNWKWTCLAESDSSTPPDGGNWCIKVYGGNTQGCWPGYAYQKIPAIKNGQTFLLSGWVYAQTAPPVGLYFGKINDGVITLQTGVSTKSTSWTQISCQSTFSLSSGDTAIVVLNGGMAGGPVQGYGYFDLISLQPVTGINSHEQNLSFQFYPNPFSDQTALSTDKFFDNATLTMINTFGQTVKQIENINGRRIIIERDNLPTGVYFCTIKTDNIFETVKLLIID